MEHWQRACQPREPAGARIRTCNNKGGNHRSNKVKVMQQHGLGGDGSGTLGVEWEPRVGAALCGRWWLSEGEGVEALKSRSRLCEGSLGWGGEPGLHSKL